jgi:pimeloyl-ACP methyl ester carboxylesterase
MFIQLKNHKAHVFEHNIIDSPEATIIIIPGAGMDHRIGSMMNLNNLNSKFNIISIDLPGHGFTSGEVLHSIEELSEFCSDLFGAMNIKNHVLIGHSMGGLIGIDLSLKHKSDLLILMNTSYPLMVGEILLKHAKGNLDQASEFFTKYGLFNIPRTEVKAKTFGAMGAGFYGRGKGTIQSPYGTKNIESDPQREIDVYPLKRLFNQTQKEILSHDLKACSSYRTEDIGELKNVKFIYGGKDKLARFDSENIIHSNVDEVNIEIMEDTGHFPYFERPEDLSKIIEKFISSTYI